MKCIYSRISQATIRSLCAECKQIFPSSISLDSEPNMFSAYQNETLKGRINLLDKIKMRLFNEQYGTL